MDAKEKLMMAIENLQANSIWHEEDTNRDINLVCNAAKKVETLEAENARLKEKETPKEPTKDGRCYKCTCGYPLYSGKAFANREKFCSRCGQRLDWSSDKE